MERTIRELYLVSFVLVVFQADFFWCAVFYDHSLIEKSHVVAQFGGFFHVVGGEEDGHSLISQFQKLPVNIQSRGGIQTAGGFV